MKIAIIFDADQQGGGGFYQSLRTIDLILKDKRGHQFEVIVINNKAKKILSNLGYETVVFKKMKLANLYFKLNSSRIINLLLSKIKFKNPFSSFLKMKEYNFVYFLGPSNLVNLCNEHNYMVNIYDLNHKINNCFPEYRSERVLTERETIFRNCVDKSFKIIVDTHRSKNEIKFLYNCLNDKVSIIPFNPYLPSLHEKKIGKELQNSDKFGFINEYKTFFYPAQFWGHKNHKYLIDAAKILQKKEKKFKFIFCGADKGNLKYILNDISSSGLGDYFKIFNFLSEGEVMFLYENVNAIVTSTFVARSTLPLYEAFYFKKNIFYSKDILDETLEELVCPFDLKNPKDLSEKLEEFIKDPNKLEFSKKIELAKKYYDDNCSDKIISNKLHNIIDEYKFYKERWEE